MRKAWCASIPSWAHSSAPESSVYIGGCGAQTAASVQTISFDRDFSRERNALLKRPYDGCGAGEGALLRAPVWLAQVSAVGEEMTCRVDYVVADAVLVPP